MPVAFVNTIDRYVLRMLLVQYAIALGVMVSLNVTLDMFVNMDEFTERHEPLTTVLANMFSYYWPNVFLYFTQLSGVITLFACMAVIARMRRQNELTAILASGVSLYRVARPIIGFGLLTTTLLVVDTELVIPSVAHLLARDHDDVGSVDMREVLFLEDRDGALLSARNFDPKTKHLHRLLLLRRDSEGTVIQCVEADGAVWEPPDALRHTGRWRLERGRSISRGIVSGQTLGPRSAVIEEFPLYFESDLNPEAIQLRQSEGWLRHLSLAQLSELEKAGMADPAAVTRARHTRTSAPIMAMLLLLLGLPFFLDRSPANILGDAGGCIILCGLCYVCGFVAQSVRTETASAWIAWLPIFVFATIAVVLIDRIRT